jgi:hypothetical protein
MIVTFGKEGRIEGNSKEETPRDFIVNRGRFLG